MLAVLPLKVIYGGQKNNPAAQAAGQTLPDATPQVGKIHPFSFKTETAKVNLYLADPGEARGRFTNSLVID